MWSGRDWVVEQDCGVESMNASAVALRYSNACRRALTLACAAALAVCTLAMASGTAWAVTGYEPTAKFGADPGPGQLSNVPAKIAVEESTGNIFVVDTGNGRVEVYAPNGTSADFLTEFGGGSLAGPTGIAVDQSTGVVYVSDTGNNRIVRYVSDGLPTPTYTVDGSYTSPAQGAGAGEVGNFGPIAVDQRNGDLLIVDAANQRVTRFLAGGGSSSFDGADSANGQFQQPADIAVDATGASYVLDAAFSVVEKFTSAGVADGTLSTSMAPQAVTTDPHTGNVIVASGGPPHLYIFNGGTLQREADFPGDTANSSVGGLAIDGGSSGWLYATLQDPFGFPPVAGVYVFSPRQFAAVTIDPPSAITATTAHVSGTVDPPTTASYHFEYSNDAGADWTSTPDQTVSVAGPVSDDLQGLASNSDYLVRLVATTADGPTASASQTFTTPIGAPGVETGLTSDRTPTTARLRGNVWGYGLQATYHFEYGTSTSYGHNAPVAAEAVAGNGFGPRAVSQPIDGLAPNATYHYRIVAANSVGTTTGSDRTFTTLASATARAYELVSPADKGGINVSTTYSQASSDGNGFAFIGASAFAGSENPTTAPLYPFYGALRTGTGWTSRALDPPQRQVGLRQRILGTLAVSSDGTKAVVISLSKLAPGAVQGDSNIYLEDTATGAYTTMGTTPGTEFYHQAGGPQGLLNVYAGGTSDFSHVLFNGEGFVFLPGAPPTALYEFTNGQLRVASLQPDGSQFPAGALPDQQGTVRDHDAHRISDDGSHVFFDGPGGLYLRLNGTHTELISVSQRSADPPGTTQGATFTGASSDGNVVFFQSVDLTDDSAPGVATLYRYVLSSNTLTMIGDMEQAPYFLQASADGAYAYFMTSTDPGGGASVPVYDFYVWHSGTLRRLATLDSESFRTFNSYRASANGRYLAFVTSATLTGAGDTSTAPAAHQQLYRYDAQADKLVCVSCPADGSSPTSDAAIGSPVAEFSHHFPSSVLDDGRTFFDTADQLASEDTNSVRDVYASDGDQATLISAGTGTADSTFLDTGADGRDAFFITKDRLVAADTDSQADLYDAREGGGLSGDSPDPTPVGCVDEGCRATGGGPSSSPPTASELTTASSHTPKAPAKAKVSVLSASFRGTTLRLRLKASGPGRLRASGSKLVSVARGTVRAGTYTLEVTLTKKNRALRRAGHRVRAQIAVSFTPAFGSRVTTKLTRTAAR
jgi:DNA-binding beta-propeller fold protein YncE